MICRKATTKFLEANESTTVLEVKKMICGIVKRQVTDMHLVYETKVLSNFVMHNNYSF